PIRFSQIAPISPAFAQNIKLFRRFTAPAPLTLANSPLCSRQTFRGRTIPRASSPVVRRQKPQALKACRFGAERDSVFHRFRTAVSTRGPIQRLNVFLSSRSVRQGSRRSCGYRLHHSYPHSGTSDPSRSCTT